MKKRPLSVTILSCLLIVAGAVELAYLVVEINGQHLFQYDLLAIALIGLAAILCGFYMLRGSNWGRWGTMVWLAFHVMVSAFHALRQLVVHGLLFAVFAYFLFRVQAAEYFRRKKTAGI